MLIRSLFHRDQGDTTLLLSSGLVSPGLAYFLLLTRAAETAIITIMLGYETLTRVVYVLLVLAFVAVISYMVWYNLRIKHKTQQLESGSGQHFGRSEGIAVGTDAEHQAHLHRRH